jgi:hypothetical protein
MSLPTPPTYERYLAVDLHKACVVVGGVNARLEIGLSPRRIELEAWPTRTPKSRWSPPNSHLRRTACFAVQVCAGPGNSPTNNVVG